MDNELRLDFGSHERPSDGACVMEYVSILAGEEFTDSPSCSDPGVTYVAQTVNDTLGEMPRQRLLDQIHRLVNTRVEMEPEAYAGLWRDIAAVMVASRDEDFHESTQGKAMLNSRASGDRHTRLQSWTSAANWYKTTTTVAVVVREESGYDLDGFRTYRGSVDADRTLAQFDLFLHLFEELTDTHPAYVDLDGLFEDFEEIVKEELAQRAEIAHDDARVVL